LYLNKSIEVGGEKKNVRVILRTNHASDGLDIRIIEMDRTNFVETTYEIGAMSLAELRGEIRDDIKKMLSKLRIRIGGPSFNHKGLFYGINFVSDLVTPRVNIELVPLHTHKPAMENRFNITGTVTFVLKPNFFRAVIEEMKQTFK